MARGSRLSANHAFSDDGRLDPEAPGFIKEIVPEEIIFDLVDTGEFRFTVLWGNTTFTYLDADNATPDISEGIKCSVVIKWPGFKFSLSLLRKQPVINYVDSVED